MFLQRPYKVWKAFPNWKKIGLSSPQSKNNIARIGQSPTHAGIRPFLKNCFSELLFLAGQLENYSISSSPNYKAVSPFKAAAKNYKLR